MKIKVQVKLYGTLRRHRPAETGPEGDSGRRQPFTISLPIGSTVADLAGRLGLDDGSVNTAAVNGEVAEISRLLNEGDLVGLFPPAAGGRAAQPAGEQGLAVFLAGVMQGSRLDHLIDEQDYRHAITDALQTSLPGVQIIDPYARNPDSVEYDEQRAVETFFTNTALAAEADVLIAYLPTASMGTAIEMWTAYHAGAYIVAVTPLVHNWVVKVTADEVLPDLDSLLEAIKGGRIARRSGGKE